LKKDAMMPGFGSISVAQLFRLIGTPDQPHLIDVRTEEDFAADPRLIPTARHMSHLRIAETIGQFGERGTIVICQRGKKLSEGAAAFIRAAGKPAESLEGGMLAWLDAGLPALPANFLPRTNKASLWVTRHRPKIDRIACPWLIRRFIEPEAQFLFVSPTEVLAVAEHFGATPFDIEGVQYSHRGDFCSFDAILDDFGLRTEALDRLALVVRGADTDRHDLAPEAAGLLAISVGLSRQYRNDEDQLEAGILLYDALYRWARDGFDEGHDWPLGRPQ
jgi:rhodanese-related sulfurtransferase